MLDAEYPDYRVDMAAAKGGQFAHRRLQYTIPT
jgi:hypothetical protein